MDYIIEAKNIGKKYHINHEQGKYVALRDVIMNIIRRPFVFIKDKAKSAVGSNKKEDFWALKNINFAIKPGEVVGIIGKNGAGKSTLLKILSQITPPTSGEITLHGKIGSLLEVGTGFHPELTGRENIFLNGAIIGMKRKEIVSKFDDIVQFAGISKFLDTPVKYYSSGMYVRLAFSVAAHMEPDILLVDEVLAVGDADFQKKCLGKMEEVTKNNGRTIIFVSHNMAAIEQLCNRCIHIENGQIKKDGNNVPEIIKEYLKGDGGIEDSVWINKKEQFKNQFFSPSKMYVTNLQGQIQTSSIRNDVPININIEAYVEEIEPALTVGYSIYNEDNHLIFRSYQTDSAEDHWPKMKTGKLVLKSVIPPNLLNEGNYRIELTGGLHNRAWFFEPNKGGPSIYLSIQGGLSQSPYWTTKRPGILAPIMPWTIDNN
jgi:lipopolysaccharide transport system ATP-binding protein